MKKITILFLVFVMILPAALFAASEPIKDLSLGNKWYYKESGGAMGGGSWREWIIEEVVGDTLIDSTVFKKIKIYTQRNFYLHESIYQNNIISYNYEQADTSKTAIAYYWSTESNIIKYTLYDFIWYTGDIILIEGPALYYPAQITVTGKGDTLLWGQPFKYIKINTMEYRWYPNTNDYFIINKIGIVELSSYYHDNSFYKQLTGAVIDGVMYGDTTSTLAIKEEQPQIPANMVMLGNYPNPFNMATSIEFTLPVRSGIELMIYNSLGQEVKRFAEEYAEPGTKTLLWDGCDAYGHPLTSGIYIYNLQLESGQIISNKMLLLK